MPSRRLDAVAQLTDSLGRATTLEDVYAAALDAIQASLTDRAAVLLFDEEGVMSFVAWRGISDSYRSAVNGHTPWTSRTTDPVPITIRDVRAEPSLAKYEAVFQAEGIGAIGFLPLAYRGRVIGKFMLYYGEVHDFSADEIQFAMTIAGQIAFGVARVLAEKQLNHDRDRLEFLNAGSELLASSLDYELTLDHVAQLICDRLADWCTIDIIEDDGRIRRLSVRHRTVRDSEALRKVRSVYPGTYQSIVPSVIATGKGLLTRDASASFAALRKDNPQLADAVAELGISSFMTVPLRTGGRTIGAIGIVCADPARQFDAEDLGLAEELGRRAAYAIDNARLFREAQDANRAKDDFLATLSHELRTPMTATLGWAAMLKIGEVSAETFKTAVDTIDRSTRAQAKLIDDILDVSRIVTGKLEISAAPVSLANVAEAAEQAIRPTASAKGIALEVRIDDRDAILIGDAGRLQQVIWNLLSNAVKFTGRGGTITLAVERARSGFASVTVTDSGIGIERHLLPHIFERFRQGDSSTTRTQGGLGLGLAIVKSLVELHGGAVRAESEGKDRGSRFTVTFPVRAWTEQSAADPDAPRPMSLAGVEVLLVEDQPDTRLMLKSALIHFGAHVTAVDSVEAALDAIESVKPSIVVSDIGMPGQDGYDLILKLRSGTVERLRAIPAIALTAYAREEDRKRAFDSGFTHHMAKPVDPIAVVKAVGEAVARLRNVER